MSQKRGYQAFGSFFSDNVEDMIRSSEAGPDPASVVPDADLLPEAPAELGAAARRHFLVDFGAWTFLNHGAFGHVPLHTSPPSPPPALALPPRAARSGLRPLLTPPRAPSRAPPLRPPLPGASAARPSRRRTGGGATARRSRCSTSTASCLRS